MTGEERTCMDIPVKEALIKNAGDLKVLPFVARKVLDTIGDERSSVADLSDIIEKDQTISARVLKISNSALYGLRQEVTSVHHALLLLGFKTIRSLVLSVSTKSLYKQFGMKEKIIWDHSVGAAIAAKIISAGFGSEVEEIAFIGGLMHDIGKVVLNNETPEAFSEVIMKIYNDGSYSMDAEEEMYGYNHAEIGAKVAEKWGFPARLVKIIGNHHLTAEHLDEVSDSMEARSIACVNIADNICKVLGIGYRDPDESLSLVELPSAVFLNLDKVKLDELVRKISEAYESEKSAFD
jgi:putative nucleotidyltransferase with HDIG domain